MFEVASAAVDEDPENKVTLKMDKIWFFDVNAVSRTPIRGRGRTQDQHRGNRGGARGRGYYGPGTGSLMDYAAAAKSPPLCGVLNMASNTQEAAV